MFFPEDTSMAAKIGIALSVILIILVTLLYYDSKKIKARVQSTKPPYFFTDRKGYAYNPSDTIPLYDMERVTLGENTQTPKQFLGLCKKQCYYHPECVAIVAEQDPVDSAVSKCTLKAENFLKEDPNSVTHFIRRNAYPGSSEFRDTIRNQMKSDHLKLIQGSLQQQQHPQVQRGQSQQIRGTGAPKPRNPDEVPVVTTITPGN